MFDQNEFRKYAVKHRGINGLTFDQYAGHVNASERRACRQGLERPSGVGSRPARRQLRPRARRGNLRRH